MKELLLLRHAKSSWAQPGLDDESRPLNNRGLKQCVNLRSWFERKGVSIQHALVSPAERTRETWDGIKAALPGTSVEIEPSLYLGDIDSYLTSLFAQDADSVMIVGHNPTCDELSRYLASPSEQTNHLMARHFGTATLAWFEFDTDEWSTIGRGSGRLKLLLRPSDIQTQTV